MPESKSFHEQSSLARKENKRCKGNSCEQIVKQENQQKISANKLNIKKNAR